MSYLSPESYVRRSLTYHQHKAAQYSERNGAALVERYSNEDTLEQLQTCALLDLSELQRSGVRGSKTQSILNKVGLPFPDSPNGMQQNDVGVMVARLGVTECWILDNPLLATSHVSMLDIYAQKETDCYPLYCQHSHVWFAITGRYLPELMAKICGVDLRETAFPIGKVVQTSVARVSAIIIHHEVKGVPTFSILSDSSSAEYLWSALFDAMQEYKGKAVGLGAFYPI